MYRRFAAVSLAAATQPVRPTSSVVRMFASNVKPLFMPALSPTMESGVIVKWLVKDGDQYNAGDALCDVQTDKATLGLELPEGGVMGRVLAPIDTPLKVGELIALTVQDKSQVEEALKFDISTLPGAKKAPAAAPAAAPAKPAAAAAAPKEEYPPDFVPISKCVVSSTPGAGAGAAEAAPAGKTGGFVTPAARHYIDSHHLDANAIVGTGPGGRILKSDVLAAMKTGGAKAAPAAQHAHHAPAAAAKPAAPAAAPAAPASTEIPAARGEVHDTKPSQVRKIIAQRLTDSKANVPHLYMVMDCPLDKALAARKELIASAGITLSVNDMIVKAVALALKEVPRANARWDDAKGAVVEQSSADVSVAVATEGGLITPIVKAAHTLNLTAINSTIKELATRARANKLKPEEFQGGTFTVSNLGMFGIGEFTAVINPPQACILAVGSGQPTFALAPGASEPHVSTVMSVQLSADRRVLDEVTAAQFLQAFNKYISQPLLL